MWVKFRLNNHASSDKWNYHEYDDELYKFDDADDLGNHIWEQFYTYNTKGSLEFETIELPPREEILKIISSKRNQITELEKEIRNLNSLLIAGKLYDNIGKIQN